MFSKELAEVLEEVREAEAGSIGRYGHLGILTVETHMKNSPLCFFFEIQLESETTKLSSKVWTNSFFFSTESLETPYLPREKTPGVFRATSGNCVRDTWWRILPSVFWRAPVG